MKCIYSPRAAAWMLTVAAVVLGSTTPVQAAQADSVVARGGSIQIDASDVRTLVASLPDGTRRIAIPPLATVHAKVVAALRAQRAQLLEQAYVQQVATKLDITVDQIELAKLQTALNQ